MYKIFSAATLILSGVLLTGCGDHDANLSVEKFDYYGMPAAKITAKADNIKITRVTANRGNCMAQLSRDLHDQPLESADLKFGEHVLVASSCSSLMELTVETTEGAFTYKWEK